MNKILKRTYLIVDIDKFSISQLKNILIVGACKKNSTPHIETFDYNNTYINFNIHIDKFEKNITWHYFLKKKIRKLN